MPTKDFSIGEAVGFGWNTVTQHLFFFIGLVIVVFVLEGIPQGLASYFEDSPGLAVLFNLVAVAVQLLLTMGVIRIALKFVDHQPAEFGDLFSCGPLFVSFFIASLFYGLMVGIGTVLLIVPGIILAIIFAFYQYVIVDRGLGPIEALQYSARLTQGVRWHLFLFGLAIIGINLLGALALIIGLLVTIPTTMVAATYVYRQLDRQTQTTAA